MTGNTDPLGERQDAAQREPPHGIDLSGFPADALPVSKPLFRAHSKRRGPWWFSSDGSGRFDLHPPRGTCYAADGPAPALRERLGPSYSGGGRAPAQLIDETLVTEIQAPKGRGASLEGPTARNYPITGELVAMTPYTVPRAWAAAFDRAGFEAIHYRGRFSHSFGVVCWALFDRAGAQPHSVGPSMTGRDACTAAGIAVMPPPPTDPSTLRVVAPNGT